MQQFIKILIVEDHPAMIEGYKSILSNSNYVAEIAVAYNCEAAYNILSKSNCTFDIFLLDVILPPYEPQNLFSGEDIGVLIRKNKPNSKIIMLTSHADSFTLYNIIRLINPEGLLVKSDFIPEELLKAFENVIRDEGYYSFTARLCLKSMQSKAVYLDNCNRRIISLLAKGIRTKSLPSHLNLSISAIDKRKAQIKEIFNIEKGTDEDILREAKKNGFI